MATEVKELTIDLGDETYKSRAVVLFHSPGTDLPVMGLEDVNPLQIAVAVDSLKSGTMRIVKSTDNPFPCNGFLLLEAKDNLSPISHATSFNLSSDRRQAALIYLETWTKMALQNFIAMSFQPKPAKDSGLIIPH